MILKCIAIDDEPLALKQIEQYIAKTPFLECIASSLSAVDGLNKVYENNPDLIFVDINMPEINGIDLVKSLDNSNMVIFTTAYSEFAIEGFKLNATDYLLKPISYSDFLKSATKAKDLFELKNSNEKIVNSEEYLFVKSEYRRVRIKLSDIKYIEGMREYIKINLSDGSHVMTLINMKSIEEKLPDDKFMRVHRSFIVNLDKITVIERQRIIFDKNIYIPVGDQYKSNFENYIKKNFL